MARADKKTGELEKRAAGGTSVSASTSQPAGQPSCQCENGVCLTTWKPKRPTQAA